MELKITNLNKSYGEKKVLENVEFTFEEGKIYGLLGRNGAVAFVLDVDQFRKL